MKIVAVWPVRTVLLVRPIFGGLQLFSWFILQLWMNQCSQSLRFLICKIGASSLPCFVVGAVLQNRMRKHGELWCQPRGQYWCLGTNNFRSTGLLSTEVIGT